MNAIPKRHTNQEVVWQWIAMHGSSRKHSRKAGTWFLWDRAPPEKEAEATAPAWGAALVPRCLGTGCGVCVSRTRLKTKWRTTCLRVCHRHENGNESPMRGMRDWQRCGSENLWLPPPTMPPSPSRFTAPPPPSHTHPVSLQFPIRPLIAPSLPPPPAELASRGQKVQIKTHARPWGP